ncbi:MAG TPA: hypothetical protein PLY90_01755 [Candidatus Hydrogenedentes bacterium]|jgi:DNA-directed RNA polymerase subunit RPC12/RpoP|nr:MAG: hypothetical protein BWY07_01832 [Candidatus Hydrogenedentes bacterium ADurb.Bin170]HNZ48849.1 hypothetical protein [Candidatus Hydrogenedentota bacterium]HOD95932.1 hypothetical protein [Candidatus Hydrogenedentota bacterium]HOM48675.1 hypothetical protein [Candidatus Hydrogenedentota bacterium]HOR51336.1 hypothetical protein [Candidatus Hydrogenedentota bacterium]
MKRLLLVALCLCLLSPGTGKIMFPSVEAAESISAPEKHNNEAKNWLCSKCSTKVESPSQPNGSNCPSGGMHRWNNLGEVGDTVYLCDKCSIKVKSKSRPNGSNCPAGGMHHWNKLTN